MNARQRPRRAIDTTELGPEFSVLYWRERFAKLFEKYFELNPGKDMIDLADKLGAMSADFESTRGYFKLQNIKNKRGTLQATALAVTLLVQVIGDEREDKPSRLRRQKLSK